MCMHSMPAMLTVLFRAQDNKADEGFYDKRWYSLESLEAAIDDSTLTSMLEDYEILSERSRMEYMQFFAEARASTVEATVGETAAANTEAGESQII